MSWAEQCAAAARRDRQREVSRNARIRRNRRDVFDLALEAAGHCMICEKQFEGRRLIHLDHCHETGELRGLLCPSCNTGLGKLGDTVAGLRRAIAYLER